MMNSKGLPLTPEELEEKAWIHDRRELGFYWAIIRFEPLVASIGYWNGRFFSFPMSSDAFYETEMAWIGLPLKVEDGIPESVRIVCKIGNTTHDGGKEKKEVG